MKKTLLIFLCLFVLTAMSACINVYPDTNPDESQTEDVSAAPTDTPLAQTAQTQIPSLAPVDSPPTSAISTATPAQTPSGMSPDPVNTASFYSSYAFMVSYDPARGWADFDYFDMLTGQDAVDWLVAEEGYTLADAQAEVADYADGEFICKNTNPQLRTIDLKNVPIKLMYHSDGTPVSDSTPIDSTVADVFALYNLDTAYLFNDYFFYIHVDADGNVTLVEQIYWC